MLHQQLLPRLPNMKALLITFVLALTTFFISEGHEEVLPATIPLGSYPRFFQMFENLPIQTRSARAAPEISNSEPQTRYTHKNPWYYSAKRNNDVSRLAMRILKRSGTHLGWDDSEI